MKSPMLLSNHLQLSSWWYFLVNNRYNHQGYVVNSAPPSAAYMHQGTGSALVHVMACRLFGAKPLPKPMLGYSQLDSEGTNLSEILIKIQNFSFTKMHLKISSSKWRPFCSGGDEFISEPMSYCVALIEHTGDVGMFSLYMIWVHWCPYGCYIYIWQVYIKLIEVWIKYW